jgi:hypothetical protein
MTLSNNVVGCDYCEHTSAEDGRYIYECDGCGTDVCADCSVSEPDAGILILCSPEPSSGHRGCAKVA